MGIMVTYGSYVKDDVNLNKSINQIEIFDTGVAFLAGMMIIPAVFVFLGTEGMAFGPSLIFISLSKVFKAMCGIIGIYSLVTAVLICLGYNVLYFELSLPNGAAAQLYDQNCSTCCHACIVPGFYKAWKPAFLTWQQSVILLLMCEKLRGILF